MTDRQGVTEPRSEPDRGQPSSATHAHERAALAHARFASSAGVDPACAAEHVRRAREHQAAVDRARMGESGVEAAG